MTAVDVAREIVENSDDANRELVARAYLWAEPERERLALALSELLRVADAATLSYAERPGPMIPEMEALGRVVDRLQAALNQESRSE